LAVGKVVDSVVFGVIGHIGGGGVLTHVVGGRAMEILELKGDEFRFSRQRGRTQSKMNTAAMLVFVSGGETHAPMLRS
jgi:hypothetical protein